MNLSQKDRFLCAQMFDSRQDHNQFRMFNKESINFFMEPSDKIEDIISKKEIINNLDDSHIQVC